MPHTAKQLFTDPVRAEIQRVLQIMVSEIELTQDGFRMMRTARPLGHGGKDLVSGALSDECQDLFRLWRQCQAVCDGV